MKTRKIKLTKKQIIVSLIILLIVMVILSLIFISSFALDKPIKSVEFTPKNLNYQEGEKGSWNLKESASFAGEDSAYITFELNSIEKNDYEKNDYLLFVDSSSYYSSSEKRDMTKFVDDALSHDNNRVGYMQYVRRSDDYNDVYFTKNNAFITRYIGCLNYIDGHVNTMEDLEEGLRNYQLNQYEALKRVENYLSDYNPNEHTKVNVIIITNRMSVVDYPNEFSEYKLIKDKFPFANINLVYRGNLSKNDKYFSQISDNVYSTTEENFYNILKYASLDSEYYKKFNLSSYIDDDYFEIADDPELYASQGIAKIKKEDGKNIVEWNLDNYQSGIEASLKVKVKLKDKFVNKNGIYSINKKNVINYEISGQSEEITSIATPKLKNYYQVTYSDNAPEGCSVNGTIPEAKEYNVFNKVPIQNNEMTCGDYQFDGWKTDDESINMGEDNTFVMPERDVKINATWRRVALTKSMDGTLHEEIISEMMSISDVTSGGLWSYDTSINKIIIQDTIQPIPSAEKEFDISKERNGSVMAYLVKNSEDSYYTAYIQGNGKIVLNDSSYLFGNFTNLTSIEGLANFDTSNVDDMTYMFYGDYNLTSIDFLGFDFRNARNISSMFNGCKKLTGIIDLSKMKVSRRLQDMSFLLANSGISGAILPEMEDSGYSHNDKFSIDGLFKGCSSLKSFSFESLKNYNVTIASRMFASCYNLETVDFTGIKENPTNYPQYATKIDMSNMFYECNSLHTINLENVGKIYANDVSLMFYNCRSLKSLDMSKIDVSNVKNMSNVFYYCSQIENLDLSTWDTSKVEDMSEMFRGCSNMKSLILGFGTANVTDMSGMFQYCKKLLSLDVTSFDVNKVTNMSEMFSGCSELTELNLSNFFTKNVKDFNYMFYSCSKLTSININNFDTSNATTMAGMFDGCSVLTDLDISNFNTKNVTDLTYMFSGCSALTTLNLSNFETPALTNMKYMFSYCENLINLNISKMSTEKVTNMDYLFGNCKKLTTLDLRNFNTSNVTSMWSMFYNCFALSELNLSSFNTENVTSMSEMFANNKALVNLDLSNFYTPKLKSANSMFYYCALLTNLDISKFQLSSASNISRMFYGCRNLQTSLTINGNSFNYYDIFEYSATNDGGIITINYLSSYLDYANAIIEQTKNWSTDTNIVLGSECVENSVVINDSRVVSDVTSAYIGTKVKLSLNTISGAVSSFRMNGELINGSEFVMPNASAIITDVKIKEFAVVESAHKPYLNSENRTYYSYTFNDAKRIRVTLTYQTEGVRYDYVSIYDSSDSTTPVGKYGNLKKTTEVIYLDSNYIKINYNTDDYGNNYYGFYAYIEPIYE